MLDNISRFASKISLPKSGQHWNRTYARSLSLCAHLLLTNSLSITQTQSVIVKETLMGRKNVSPQNLYETGQLYSAGALKVACVGLQCVGYNIALNRTIMEQAAKCHASGRWRTGWTGSGPPMLSSGTISAPPMITGDVLLGDLISSSNSGITHPHLQKSLPVNTSEFDASAPAAAAAASAAASVLNEGSHTVSQHRVLSMFNSM